mmetsp:Transcript_61286/g.179718  ORF Transcript_61286/g.179718 Transcript_61286/m.179718 type:complete len:164 (-) Transcript_61286:192-683(-)
MSPFAARALSGLVRGAVRMPVAPLAPRIFAPTQVAFRSFSAVKYAKSHEWVKMDGDTATLGISDFAQSALGEVVYCDLPEEGATFKAKETLCTLESVKAVGEVYAPGDCEVVAVNEVLSDEPATVNSDCQGNGWLVKLKFSSAPADLMDEAAYQKHLESEKEE